MLMIKKVILVLVFGLLVTACTSLNREDRKLLDNMKVAVDNANLMSTQALCISELNNEKTERMFKQSQKK
jgi:hypothetical protein